MQHLLLLEPFEGMFLFDLLLIFMLGLTVSIPGERKWMNGLVCQVILSAAYRIKEHALKAFVNSKEKLL